MEGWRDGVAVMLMRTSVAAYNLGAVKEPSLHNPPLQHSITPPLQFFATPILRHSDCL